MIQILDDVLPNDVSNHLLEITTSQNFPWYFVENSAKKDVNNKLNYSWFHMLYINNNIVSQYYDSFNIVSLILINNFKLKDKKIERLRLGNMTSMNTPVINNPHTDYLTPHLTILYYLNDSDGDTYFYKDKEGKETMQIISPKRNRAVLFDGLIPHSSSKPVNNPYRIVLNINLT